MVPKFVKETLLQLKPHIDTHTLTVGDLNIPLSPVVGSFRQKLNREMLEQTEVINQRNLTDIYRTFHSNTNECIFFFCTSCNFLRN